MFQIAITDQMPDPSPIAAMPDVDFALGLNSAGSAAERGAGDGKRKCRTECLRREGEEMEIFPPRFFSSHRCAIRPCSNPPTGGSSK